MHLRIRRLTRFIAAIAALLALSTSEPAHAGGIPGESPLVYAGVLENASGVVAGTHRLRASFFATGDSGAALCEAEADVDVVGGHFRIGLPAACTATVTQRTELWLEMAVDEKRSARAKIGAVPYSLEATNAVTASSLTGTSVLKPLGGVARAFGDAVELDRHQGFWQAESVACATDAAGVCILTFPRVFPNATITTLVSNGDAGFATITVGTHRVTSSGMSVRTNYPSGTVRINYVAFGF